MAIATFLDSAHKQHNPPVESLHGHLVPYFESPVRVEKLSLALLDAGLIEIHTPTMLSSDEIAATHAPDMVNYLRVLSETSQAAIQEDFAVYDLQHQLTGDEYYYENVFPGQMQHTGNNQFMRKTYFYDNTSPVGQGTWAAALGSASSAAAGATRLLQGEKQAYALCRPPGHHAGRSTIGGYCYLNNAAIAANQLKSRGRVAILDIDYHHGNGTQEIFWEEDAVFYVSIHADPSVDYPYYTGYVEENHASNLNIPLSHGTTADVYLEALKKAVAAIQAFAPASIIISLGFDTYRHDPMGRFELDVSVYEEIGRYIAAIGVPTLYVQEGGYAIEALGALAVTFFRGVLG